MNQNYKLCGVCWLETGNPECRGRPYGPRGAGEVGERQLALFGGDGTEGDRDSSNDGEGLLRLHGGE